ncbi:MAG: 2,3-bisphosphoglycerate-independent phosphoglycerate mutase [Candidatus Thermoplasmatota archaeon]|nr:2,3-bisphosphoglycerate-independent phosphoglycerate mutase [Candidatus Thermoplasmatota archaeon]
MKRIPHTKKLLLVILDGWGHSDEREHNAIALANTPNFDDLVSEFPFRLIEASQEHVGLPHGQMGNSEVGHLTIGAGRVIYQPLVKINRAIKDGSINDNEEISKGIENAKRSGATLHLLGLTSEGGVHSHIEHLKALINLALKENVRNIRIHVITDGRDVPPRSAAEEISSLIDWIGTIDPDHRVKIATVMGRFYAMDRDRRWDRTEEAFNYYISPQDNVSSDPVKYILGSYDRDVSDEFIKPVQIVDGPGSKPSLVKEGDTLLFFNFRPDRARQLTKAFIYPFFGGFVRPKAVRPYFVAMTDYDESMFTHVGFPEESVTMGIGEVISRKGLRQLRIAETEKYPHVTFFFSGGREDPYPNEARILVPSPQVRTYDQKPEMSAPELADAIVKELEGSTFDLGVLNFANSDMVGHTGILEAAKAAVEAVDSCIGKVVKAGLDAGYHLLFTADHGNSEKMWDTEKNVPFTAHTTNPVPFIYVCQGIGKAHVLSEGDMNLSHIGRTILHQLDIAVPTEMSSPSLVPET